ncbi:hypothetical protein M885DRAFT_558700 [Pelagophyceae sp. CCMP2097]|nr:hypothetical protein M885DRAFT_558700 [Pelagophyceae sp. CCMP2097]
MRFHLLAALLVAPAFGKCADDPAWFAEGNNSTQGCAWVSLEPVLRCKLEGSATSGFEAAVACPIACDSCLDLLCEDAEAQSPVNVSEGAVGLKTVRIAPLAEVEKLVFVNMHFHQGAEHYSQGEYDAPHEGGRCCLSGQGDCECEACVWADEDNFCNENSEQCGTCSGGEAHWVSNASGGFYCDALRANSSAAMLEPYDFQYCQDVQVGQTYELDWVYSTGGTNVTDGLGGAFVRQANPAVVVQAQVFLVVNDEAYDIEDLATGWASSLATDAVKYLGSTTGSSYDNEVCSPVMVSWHVDRACHFISAASLDATCRVMKEDYGLDQDLEPHSARDLVLPEWTAESVEAL